MKHECSGCQHWKWHPKDKLYDAPGYHLCEKPNFCERFNKKKVQRDSFGFITDKSISDMVESLPIEVFVNYDNKPHRTIQSATELHAFLFGALPYALITYYRSK